MPTFRVTGVGSDGLRVRSGPNITEGVVGALAEGTQVEGGNGTMPGGGHNWRQITSPQDGFVADEFLTSSNGGPGGGTGTFHVAGVGADGLRVRSAPSIFASVIGALAEGTTVEAEGGATPADGHNWRHITSPQDGFVAGEFLAPGAGSGGGGGGIQPGHLSAAALFDLVRGHGAGAGLDRIMVAAALAESEGNPNANGDNGHSIGLWQMHDHGLGSGLTVAQRSDPDLACEKILPHFRNAHDDSIAQGFSGRSLAARTYVFTERPAGFPSLESAAALKFLGKFDLLS